MDTGIQACVHDDPARQTITLTVPMKATIPFAFKDMNPVTFVEAGRKGLTVLEERCCVVGGVGAGDAVCREIAPAGDLLSLTPKKEGKERRPRWLRPFASLRATCGARDRGARPNSLRACALRSNIVRESVHAACASCGAPAHPAHCAPRRIQRGEGTERAIAALGPKTIRSPRPSAAMARLGFTPLQPVPRSAGPGAGPGSAACPCFVL